MRGFAQRCPVERHVSMPANTNEPTKRRPHAALALAFSLLSAACGPNDESAAPASPPRCKQPPPLRGAALEGVLEIGSGGPTNFAASEDGDHSEIVVGSQ